MKNKCFKKNKTTGLNRNIIDKYYTKEEIVNQCLIDINKEIKITNEDLCIEPSAGNGAFIMSIKKLFSNYLFFDIEPENDEIKKQDYLELDHNQIKDTYNKIHIIGNPPFGRQSSLAIKFIKKSTKYCDSISFILPKSFKKDSLKKHFALNFHLIFERDIPEDSFLVNNKSYSVPCVFQIWLKKDSNRIVPKKLKPINYSFVKKDDNPDICFRRVGVYAGNIDKNIDNKSIQSHYFIKFNSEITTDMYYKLSTIDFKSKDNTVGPKSISKQELIKEFNKLLI